MIRASAKGFEKFYNPFRMWLGMTIRIFVFLFSIHILLSISFAYFYPEKFVPGIKSDGVCIVRTYYSSLGKVFMHSLFNKECTIQNNCQSTSPLMTSKEFMGKYTDYVMKVTLIAFKNIGIFMINTTWFYFGYVIFFVFFSLKNIKDTKDKHLRGAKLIKPEELTFLMQNRGKSFLSYINLKIPVINFKNFFKKGFNPFYGYKFKITNNISIPESIVTRSTFIIGRPGTGKSQLAYKFLEHIINTNKRCIVHDFKGDFVNYFYDSSKHFIFNPLDKRYPGWNIFNDINLSSDITRSVDIESLCSSLIPVAHEKDKFWPLSAQSVFNGILQYCTQKNLTTYSDLLNIIYTPNETLAGLLSEVDAEEAVKLLSTEKTADLIFGYLSNYIKFLRYLEGTEGDFSIKNWINDEDSDYRVIFLTNQAMVQETLKPILTLFIDFATKMLCSLDESLDRRVYFMLDEIHRLGTIESIIPLLTTGRSKGAASIIFTQDFAQLSRLYGNDGSKSIFNACGNSITFSVSDESTAEVLSKMYGEREIERTEENTSMGVVDFRDSEGESPKKMTDKIILPSEIMNLETFNFYLKLTDVPVTKDSFTFREFKKRSPAFIWRETSVDRSKRGVSDGENEDSIDKMKQVCFTYTDRLKYGPPIDDKEDLSMEFVKFIESIPDELEYEVVDED